MRKMKQSKIARTVVALLIFYFFINLVDYIVKYLLSKLF
ncbi:hypothetical protein MCERE19_00693 [Spirosomataceae bacterium]